MREKLRKTFDVDPELYDRARPQYLDALFENLVEVTQLNQGSILLEIGMGTGQATLPLARMGFDITTVDIGSNMSSFTQEKLKPFNNVEVINTSFEEAELAKESYDLIYSATAFHWIDPAIRYKKSHELLKKDGYLAIINIRHVSDENGDKFFLGTQGIYQEFQPSKSNSGYKLAKANTLMPEEIDKKLFSLEAFEKFPIQMTYNADSYCRLLSTFSDVINLPEKRRERFLEKMSKLIRDDFNNEVTKHSVITLSVAKKITG